MSETKKKPFHKRWLFWVLLAVVAVVIVAGKNPENARAGAGQSAAPAAAAAPKGPEIPAGESSFITVVSTAQKDARGASNDMQLGGIKAKRDQELCQTIQNLGVQDWVGKVTQIGANSDGKGVFGVEIAKNITIKTWNNAFSDITHNTMLEPGSPLFNTAANLKKGQMVKFSGSFFKGTGGDCVFESSMGLKGKVGDPEFIFRFSGIAPL